MIHRSFDVTTTVRGISRQPTSVASKSSPLRTEHLRDPLLLDKLFHAQLQTLTTRTYSESYSWQGTQRVVAAEAAAAAAAYKYRLEYR
ncbi:unnamed protein product [Ectocarpus sp. 8 AP-2014]